MLCFKYSLRLEQQKVSNVPLCDIDLRFSFQKLCSLCSFLPMLHKSKICKKTLGNYCTSKVKFPHFKFLHYPQQPLEKKIICVAKLVRRIFAASILLRLCEAEEKGRKSLNKGGKDVSQSYFATKISFFRASRDHISGWMGSKIKIQMCSDMPIFFSDF